MQVQIVCIGQKMPVWVEQACADYLKRMPREMSVKVTSLPLANRKFKDQVEKLRQQESRQILSKLAPGSFNIALDEQGKHWSSKNWSSQLQSWMQNYPRVNIIIGGPDGLAAECLDACAMTISLGRMTMPHALVRVVVMEQLYRAWTILKGHPYHRE